MRAARAAGMTALMLATVSDFAVLRPDPVTGLRAHRDFRPGEAYADHRRQLEAIRRDVAAAGAEVATSAAGVDRAAGEGRTVVLLGCEGGDFLDGDLRRLEKARAAGVTVLTLVHYRANEIGDVQTEPPVHGGLSRFGRAVVAECNRLGVVVDCAHASFAATMAVLEVSSQPVIISHGQLGNAGTAHPRLLTARHVAAVAAAGGLIGAWLAGRPDQPVPGRFRHRDHPADRGRRARPRGYRHRPGRQLPARPDQLRSVRRPGRATARPRAPGHPGPADPRRQRHGTAEPHRTVNAGRAQGRAGALCAGRPAGCRSERMGPASGLDAKFREWARCRAPG